MLSLLTLVLCNPALAQVAHDEGIDETFDPDRKPDAPSPALPNLEEDARVYAGVGSGVAYSTRGTGEFGGSMSFSAAPGVTSFSADPMAGFFILDNVRLATVMGIRHVNTDDGPATNRLSLLLEPSVHFPINDGLFWAGGLGLGGAMTDGLEDGKFVGGFAVAPRTGLQLLVGRSGLLNLGVRYSMVFSNASADLEPATGQAVLSFVNTLDVQAGYTVMF